MPDSLETKKVLIVDDQVTWRKDLEYLTVRAGYSTITADSAAAAIAEIHQFSDQLYCVTLDGLEGKCWAVYEVATSLGIPVVFVTGDDEVIEAAKNRNEFQSLPLIDKMEFSPRVLKVMLDTATAKK